MTLSAEPRSANSELESVEDDGDEERHHDERHEEVVQDEVQLHDEGDPPVNLMNLNLFHKLQKK